MCRGLAMLAERVGVWTHTYLKGGQEEEGEQQQQRHGEDCRLSGARQQRPQRPPL